MYTVILAILPLLKHYQYFSFERNLDSYVTLCIIGDTFTNLFPLGSISVYVSPKDHCVSNMNCGEPGDAHVM
jgi:hypothetical protein